MRSPSRRSAFAAGRPRTGHPAAAELDALPIDATRWRDRLESPRRAGRPSSPSCDSEIVGFASIGPSRDEQGLGELYALYVEPSAWSQGDGRALIARAEEQLRQTYAAARCGC